MTTEALSIDVINNLIHIVCRKLPTNETTDKHKRKLKTYFIKLDMEDSVLYMHPSLYELFGQSEINHKSTLVDHTPAIEFLAYKLIAEG